MSCTASVLIGGAQVKGTTVVSLQTKDNGYLSRANFKGIAISPGTELCIVHKTPIMVDDFVTVTIRVYIYILY